VSWRRARAACLTAVVAVLLGACGVLGAPGGPTPSPPAPLEPSIPAFQTFSGMTVPPAAKQVSLSVVQDRSGAPAYRVDFVLPSKQVDAYCITGRMGAPLDIYTAPPYITELFGDDAGGKDPGGVKIAEAVLPDDVTLSRTVFATGTDTSTAVVRTYAYASPNR
jgi:hypothetical protein